MRFYIISFLLAFIQSSFLIGVFKSNLYVPDFVLIYLFLHLSTQKDIDLKKPIISGLYLDIMYDSFGWNVASKVFSTFLIEVFKERWSFGSKLSVVIVYLFIALLEHLLRFLLFRAKYYYPFDVYLFLAGIGVEVLVIYLLSNRVLSQRE